MQIQSLSYSTNNYKNVSKTSFQGLKPEQLLEVIPNTKVCKNLTHLDKHVFQQYIASKPFKSGVTPDEFAELSKSSGADFILNTYELLTKKFG